MKGRHDASRQFFAMLRALSAVTCLAVSWQSAGSALGQEHHDLTNIARAIERAETLAAKCNRGLCATGSSSAIADLNAQLLAADDSLQLIAVPLAELIDANAGCAESLQLLCVARQDQMQNLRTAQQLQDVLHFFAKDLLAISQWTYFAQNYERDAGKWLAKGGDDGFRSFLSHLKSHASRAKELAAFAEYQTYDDYGMSREEGEAALNQLMSDSLNSLVLDVDQLGATVARRSSAGSSVLRDPGIRKNALALLAKVGDTLLKMDRIKRRMRMGELEQNLEAEEEQLWEFIDAMRDLRSRQDETFRLRTEIERVRLMLDACHRSVSGQGLSNAGNQDLASRDLAPLELQAMIRDVSIRLVDAANAVQIETEEDILLQVPKAEYKSDETIEIRYDVPQCLPEDAVVFAARNGEGFASVRDYAVAAADRPRGQLEVPLRDRLDGNFLDAEGRELAISRESREVQVVWRDMPRSGVTRTYSGTMGEMPPMPHLGSYRLVLYSPGENQEYAARPFGVVATTELAPMIDLKFTARNSQDITDALPLPIRERFVAKQSPFRLELQPGYNAEGGVIVDGTFYNHQVKWYRDELDILEIHSKEQGKSVFVHKAEPR